MRQRGEATGFAASELRQMSTPYEVPLGCDKQDTPQHEDLHDVGTMYP